MLLTGAESIRDVILFPSAATEEMMKVIRKAPHRISIHELQFTSANRDREPLPYSPSLIYQQPGCNPRVSRRMSAA